MRKIEEAKVRARKGQGDRDARARANTAGRDVALAAINRRANRVESRKRYVRRPKYQGRECDES